MKIFVSAEMNLAIENLCKQMDIADVEEVRVDRFISDILGGDQVKQRIGFNVRINVSRSKEEE